MPHNFNTNTANHDEWLTPPEIIKALGRFDLDPCAPINRPWDTASNHYTILDNGLSKEWAGRVWCNPPYGRETFIWLERLAEHGNGVALIFARTETKGFHRQIWEKADAVFFLKEGFVFVLLMAGKAIRQMRHLALWLMGKTTFKQFANQGSAEGLSTQEIKNER